MSGIKKGSRILHQSGEYRKDRPRKRKQPINSFAAESSDTFTSSSAKKLKDADHVPLPEDNTIGYRIINFVTVFSVISEYVKCKKCNGEVTFQPEGTRGLGFKIMIKCTSCNPVFIPSCPYVDKAFEINKRFFFVLRILGIGWNGARKFCGLMDLPPPLARSLYPSIIKNICTAASTVCKILLKKAVTQEKEEVCKINNVEDAKELTVSGDGTWKKRGFNSLYGVSTLIGVYSGKVMDFVTKSAYCKACESWSKRKNLEKYIEWKHNHDEECTANHIGSAGKMEVDAIKEMFGRSEKLYGVKYTTYVGDGDSKTFEAIVESHPYDCEVKKKECIGHVQKRIGTQLQECKRKNKGLGGRNKLTAKLIDKLTMYYGLAIRRNVNSVEDMKKAIWATYYHYCSTKEKQQHENCPEGEDSWCSWQRAKSTNALDNYQQDYKSFHEDVSKAIKPIYKNLSKDNLLERCLGGFTQNNNESINHLIWMIAPKTTFCGATVVDVAANIAVCLFNEGATSLLQIMNVMGISLGSLSITYAHDEDSTRIMTAERQTKLATKEARQQRRMQNNMVVDYFQSVEGLLYGPGIDDSL